MRRVPLALAIGLALIAGVAAAEQLYRWTDEKGAVHVTDTPPPANAKNVQKKSVPSAPGQPSESNQQQPFELTRVTRDFPVKLYTSPSCQEPCSKAREALNKRGVPFKEITVWDEETNAEVKRLVGSNEVPVIVVGSSAQKGFEQGAYDMLLDSAGYPKAGILPARSQAAPPPPADYVAPEGRVQPKAEPVAPEPPAPPLGPYSPGAPPQRSQKK